MTYRTAVDVSNEVSNDCDVSNGCDVSNSDDVSNGCDVCTSDDVSNDWDASNSCDVSSSDEASNGCDVSNSDDVPSDYDVSNGGGVRVAVCRFKAEDSPVTRERYQILLSNGCNVTGAGLHHALPGHRLPRQRQVLPSRPPHRQRPQGHRLHQGLGEQLAD